VPAGTPTLGVQTARRLRRSPGGVQEGAGGGSTQRVLETVWFRT